MNIHRAAIRFINQSFTSSQCVERHDGRAVEVHTVDSHVAIRNVFAIVAHSRCLDSSLKVGRPESTLGVEKIDITPCSLGCITASRSDGAAN